MASEWDALIGIVLGSLCQFRFDFSRYTFEVMSEHIMEMLEIKLG